MQACLFPHMFGGMCDDAIRLSDWPNNLYDIEVSYFFPTSKTLLIIIIIINITAIAEAVSANKICRLAGKLGRLPWQPVRAQHFECHGPVQVTEQKNLHLKHLSDALTAPMLTQCLTKPTWISSRLSSSFLELFLLSKPSPRSRASKVVLWVGKASLDMRPPSEERQKPP